MSLRDNYCPQCNKHCCHSGASQNTDWLTKPIKEEAISVSSCPHCGKDVSVRFALLETSNGND